MGTFSLLAEALFLLFAVNSRKGASASREGTLFSVLIQAIIYVFSV